LNSTKENSNYKLQKLVVLVAFFLFFFKISAWYITSSVAIYSDALESIVNIIGSLLGLYSLYLSTLPKDENHPYGHGKIEFISAVIEGVLICLAGLIILFESFQNVIYENEIKKIDYGIYLVLFTAIVNLFLGMFTLKTGKKQNSIVLESTGKHLITDTYSTLAVILGLVVIYYTKLFWIDAVIGVLLSIFILVTGYKIVRKSIGGIMDEADEILIQKIACNLNENKKSNWIDFHNLRVIKYGPKFHIDLHLTLPYYFTVEEAHQEIEEVNELLNSFFHDQVEVFIHSDPCVPNSCEICEIQNCLLRKKEFVQKINLNLKNIIHNKKHTIES
jgi:cation diffusion facilitator family transporter